MFREDDIDDLIDSLLPRALVCLCVDTSDDLTGEQKVEINTGVGRYLNSIRENNDAINSVDLAVISYGGAAKLVRDFATISETDFIPDLFIGSNYGAKLNDAVELALLILERRKQYYIENDVDFYQPELIIIGGSKPDADVSISSKIIKNLEDEGVLTHFVFSVGDGDFIAELDKLMVSSVGLQEVSRLENYDFEGFYDRCTVYSDDISDSISQEISSDYRSNSDIEDKVSVWKDLTTLEGHRYDKTHTWQELPENDSILIAHEETASDSLDIESFEEHGKMERNNSESFLKSNSVAAIPTNTAETNMEEVYRINDLNTNVNGSNVEKIGELYSNDVAENDDYSGQNEVSIADYPSNTAIKEEYQSTNESFDTLTEKFVNESYSIPKDETIHENVDVLDNAKNIEIRNVPENGSNEHDKTCDEELDSRKMNEYSQDILPEINELEAYVVEPDILNKSLSIEHNGFDEVSESIFVESDLNDETQIPDEWAIAAQILKAHSEKYGNIENNVSVTIDGHIKEDEDLSWLDKQTDNIMDSISLYSESVDIITSELNEEYKPKEVEVAGDELDSWDNISYNHRVNENYGIEVIDMDSLTIKLRQLKLNKELLDSNAITVEEFEFVKRQILGDITRG